MNLKLGKAARSRHSNLREQHPKVRQSRSRSPPKVANQPRGPNHSPDSKKRHELSRQKRNSSLTGSHVVHPVNINKYVTVPSTKVVTCKICCNLNYLKSVGQCLGILLVWASTRVFVSPHQVAVPVLASLTQLGVRQHHKGDIKIRRFALLLGDGRGSCNC